jgi:hypothetical protein
MSKPKIELNGRIEKKLDSLDEKVSLISETVIKNTAVLEEHQRRSTINEESLELLRKEVEPIKKHVAMFSGAFKAFAAIGGVIAAIAAIVSMINTLKALF